MGCTSYVEMQKRRLEIVDDKVRRQLLLGPFPSTLHIRGSAQSAWHRGTVAAHSSTTMAGGVAGQALVTSGGGPCLDDGWFGVGLRGLQIVYFGELESPAQQQEAMSKAIQLAWDKVKPHFNLWRAYSGGFACCVTSRAGDDPRL
jgi:hypothetical protein